MLSAKVILPLVLIGVIFITACNTGSSEPASDSNEAKGEDVNTQDTTILDNYNNSYPNNRIHIQDTNLANDSARQRDSMRSDSVSRQ